MLSEDRELGYHPQLYFRFGLFACFIFYIYFNISQYRFFINQKVKQNLNQGREGLSTGERFSIWYLIVTLLAVLAFTVTYFASIIQAFMRDPHDPKKDGHKLTDSIYLLLVRIQDLLISLMITILFYRLGVK